MKSIRVAAAVLMALTLAGCMKPVRINQRAIVQGIGIDKEGEQYRLTLQIFDPTSEKPGGSLMVQAEGETISDALENASVKNGRTMFYGQNKMLVLGEAAADGEINEIIGFFNSNHQSRPNLDVLMARGNASDVIEERPEEGEQPLLSIRNMLENSESAGQVLRGPVIRIVDSLENGHTGFCMPIVAMGGQGEKKEIEMVGTAVFRHGKLAGELDRAQTRGVLWLRDEVRRTRLVVEDERLGKVSLAVADAKVKVTPSLRGDTPHFQVECTLKSHINESVVIKDGTSLPERITALQELQARLVQGEMEDTLEVCLREYGTDLFGFANLLEQREPEWFARNQSRYDELMADFTVDVRVNSKIERYGLQS